MPRMMTKALPAFWVCTRLTFDVRLMKSDGFSMPAFSMVWAVKAVIAAGTSCNDSARRVAVTMMSASFVSAAGAGTSGSCACADAAVAVRAASKDALAT